MEKDLLTLKTLLLCTFHKAIITNDTNSLPVLRSMAQGFMAVAADEYSVVGPLKVPPTTPPVEDK